MFAILESLSPQAWLLQTFAMAITAIILPGLRISSFLGPLGAVMALAFINSHIWSASLFFNLPQTASMHALMLLGVNGVIFWLVVKMVPGIEVNGLLTAFIAPVIFTVCSVLVDEYGKDINWYNLAATVLDFVSEMRDTLLESTSAEEAQGSAPLLK